MHPILAIRTEDKSRRTLVLNVIPNLKENGSISELRSSAFKLFYHIRIKVVLKKRVCFEVQIPSYTSFSYTNYNKMY